MNRNSFDVAIDVITNTQYLGFWYNNSSMQYWIGEWYKFKRKASQTRFIGITSKFTSQSFIEYILWDITIVWSMHLSTMYIYSHLSINNNIKILLFQSRSVAFKIAYLILNKFNEIVQFLLNSVSQQRKITYSFFIQMSHY